MTRVGPFCGDIHDSGWWFRIFGYGLAYKNTVRADHVLFSTRWRMRPGVHFGAHPDYPGDGRCCPEGKPVGRRIIELLTP
jgi:hypothetical protein